eukprot:scaffold251480_cov18-Tisochrysis_lutea.AAC.1
MKEGKKDRFLTLHEILEKYGSESAQGPRFNPAFLRFSCLQAKASAMTQPVYTAFCQGALLIHTGSQ